MIITMERLAHFPGAAASRPRAALLPFPLANALFYRAHARDSSPAPRSLRGPLAPPRFPREDFLTTIQSLVSLSAVAGDLCRSLCVTSGRTEESVEHR